VEDQSETAESCRRALYPNEAVLDVISMEFFHPFRSRSGAEEKCMSDLEFRQNLSRDSLKEDQLRSYDEWIIQSFSPNQMLPLETQGREDGSHSLGTENCFDNDMNHIYHSQCSHQKPFF
jgi:hypothetical protein